MASNQRLYGESVINDCMVRHQWLYQSIFRPVLLHWPQSGCWEQANDATATSRLREVTCEKHPSNPRATPKHSPAPSQYQIPQHHSHTSRSLSPSFSRSLLLSLPPSLSPSPPLSLSIFLSHLPLSLLFIHASFRKHRRDRTGDARQYPVSLGTTTPTTATRPYPRPPSPFHVSTVNALFHLLPYSSRRR